MPTISDLFKSQKKELYGKSDAIRIDSRGLINPPRGAALLLSSPNSLGDLIGNQIAGAVGGSANRPSDTIFKDKTFINKPISLFNTPSDLRNAVKEGDEYFVKQSPAGASILGKIKEGASNPLATIAEVGIDILKGLKDIDILKGLKDKNPSKGSPYGHKHQMDIDGKTLTETKTFSGNPEKSQTGFYETYEYKQLKGTSKGPKSWVVSDIKKRDVEQSITWDSQNNTANAIESYWIDYQEELLTDAERANQVWVLFKKLGNNEIIPFAGTITGLSEDVVPEWTNFRYLGSPFKTYRYQGVERSLKFELKLYYTTPLQKDAMIRKINYLKSLAFPYEQISQITHVNKNAENPPDYTPPTSQYAFSPNLVTLTIGDIYKNMFGFIQSLSFSIDDNTTWPNANFNMEKDGDNRLYPSVISVSIGFTIIENHNTITKSGITKYKYNFDGLNMNVFETQEDTQKSAPEIVNSTSTEPERKLNIPNVIETKTVKKYKKKETPAPKPNEIKKILFAQPAMLTDTLYEFNPTRTIKAGIKNKNRGATGSW